MKKLSSILAFGVIFLALLSCENSEIPSTNPTGYVLPDTLSSAYDFHIKHLSGQGVDKELEGDTIGESWNASIGSIYLGTDESAKPLGTLTMVIGPDFIQPTDGGAAGYPILSAILSTTDVRVGTGPELNARLYTLDTLQVQPRVLVVYLSETVVAGNINMKMNRVLVNSGDSEQSIQLIGDFVCSNL